MTEHITPRLRSLQGALTATAVYLSQEGTEAELQTADILELLAASIRAGRTADMLALLVPDEQAATVLASE